MPEINLFNGGINTQKDPRKLEPNEFTVVLNADVASGSVISIPNPIPSSVFTAAVSGEFVEFKGLLISSTNPYTSYALMQNKLFQADGSLVRYLTEGTAWQEAGIDGPTDALTAELLTVTGNLVTFVPNTEGTSKQGSMYHYLVLNGGHIYSYDIEGPESCIVASIDVGLSSLTGLADVYRSFAGNIELLQRDAGSFFDFDSVRGSPSVVKSFTTSAGTSRPTLTLTWDGFGRAIISISFTRNIGTGTSNTTSQQIEVEFGNGNYTKQAVVDGGLVAVTGGGAEINNYLMNDSVVTAGGNTSNFGFAINFELPAGPFNLLAGGVEAADGWTGIKGTIEITLTGYHIKDMQIAPSQTSAGGILPWQPGYYFTQEPSGILTTWVCSNEHSDLFTGTHLTQTFEGDFTYAMTYVTAGGQETVQGPVSNVVTSNGAMIEVTIPPQTLDAAVVGANIYRKNNAYGSSFLQIKTFTDVEITAGLTFIDDVDDIADLGGEIPSITLAVLPSDALFPTTHRGRMFFASKQDPEAAQDFSAYTRIVWSALGDPLEYEQLSYLNVDYAITGLGDCANGLLLFHREKTYILQGTQGEVFSYRPISNSHGCVDHRSIQGWKGSVIFASVDGISMTDGSEVKLISYSKLGILPLTVTDLSLYDPAQPLATSLLISSAVVSNQYFLLLTSGIIIRLDLETGVFTNIEGSSATGLGHINGELYGAISDRLNLLRYDVEGTRTYTVVTGKVTDSALCNLKEYNKVRVSSTGSCALTVTIDENDVLVDRLVTEPSEYIGLPNEKNKGYSITFKLVGVGSLHAIEYSVKGRDNG